ncbi:MAG: gluconeogenesis factor YvcK family protein [Clostridia bacterium]
MNGFMHWFKSSSKMKRWMFLILIGIILMCYGLAEVLVLKELSVIELSKIIVTFVIGFVAIILGLVFLNKRTLEVLIESTDDRMNDNKNVNVKSLIFNKKVYHQGPNIVVIGGGTGLNTVLSGLKKYTDNLTAIVTVSDYGEEKTESRRELGTLPIGDIKDSMIALSAQDGEIEKLLNYKFSNGRLNNLTFADIYFSAMRNINNDFSDSIIKSNEVLNIIGKVIPVTLDEMNIVAELANGYVVTEKSKIPEITYEKVTKINRIYLNPTNCRPAPGVIDAIKEADCIIIGPGSLYTNVIPNLLVNGVAKAIKESTALKVYISNIMTEPGQTDEYSVSDHLNAIIEHCGKGIVDYCIYDTGEIVPEFIKRYNLEGQDLVIPDIDKVKGITYLQRNLSTISDGCIRHDPELVASSIIELICDDLKYQDKQNDPQYLMLNNKLKEDKRISKIKKQMKKDEKKNNKHPKEKNKRNSKFQNKYSDRIASIKEADEMLKIKNEKLNKKAQKDKKTPQEIREEMLKQLNDSKLK